MPPQQNKPAPDFIPADPDFIPAESGRAAPHQYTADEASGGPFMQQVEQEAFGPQYAAPNEGALHHVMRGASNFGGAAAGAIPEMLAHPIDTAKQAFGMSPVGEIWNAAHGQAPPGADIAKSFKEHPEETLESTAGNIVGGIDAAGLMPEALARVPTKEGAGRLFQSVMNEAGDKPVKLTRALEPLERAQQLSARGGGTVSAADNLYKRINTVNPLDYREARDWASNLSRISAQDKMSASPSLRAEVGKLSKAFNQDIGDTAESVGRGADYNKAMRNYHLASTVGDVASKAKKYAVPAALGAAGAGAGYKLARALMPDR